MDAVLDIADSCCMSGIAVKKVGFAQFFKWHGCEPGIGTSETFNTGHLYAEPPSIARKMFLHTDSVR